MASLYAFIDGTFADIRSKLDTEYQERLIAHEKKISEELSPEDYTANYGKITDILASACALCTELSAVVDDICSEGRWIVHCMFDRVSVGDGPYKPWGRATVLIDNYGKYYIVYSYNESPFTLYKRQYRSATNTVNHVYTHPMPNFLIDYCKTLITPCMVELEPGNAHDINVVGHTSCIYKYMESLLRNENALQLLAEQYYKRFVSMKPLFTSGRFTEYATLQAEKVSLEEELLAAKKQIAELRVENQCYVDTVFHQRSEITSYKKQLLEVTPTVAISPINLGEMLTEAVKKFMTPTLEISESLSL